MLEIASQRADNLINRVRALAINRFDSLFHFQALASRIWHLVHSDTSLWYLIVRSDTWTRLVCSWFGSWSSLFASNTASALMNSQPLSVLIPKLWNDPHAHLTCWQSGRANLDKSTSPIQSFSDTLGSQNSIPTWYYHVVRLLSERCSPKIERPLRVQFLNFLCVAVLRMYARKFRNVRL